MGEGADRMRRMIDLVRDVLRNDKRMIRISNTVPYFGPIRRPALECGEASDPPKPFIQVDIKARH